MTFTPPETVLSPKGIVKNVRVLLNTGPEGWSLARLQWEGKEVVGLRWNGDTNSPLGNPQSRGIPTWFVLPDEIAQVVEAHYAGEALQLPFTGQPESNHVRIRPLPIRIAQGRRLEPRDDVWTVSKIDHDQQCVTIANSTTGHFLTLHPAHIKAILPDSSPSADGFHHWLIELRVQMVIEDVHVRLEPRP